MAYKYIKEIVALKELNIKSLDEKTASQIGIKYYF